MIGTLTLIYFILYSISISRENKTSIFDLLFSKGKPQLILIAKQTHITYLS